LDDLLDDAFRQGSMPRLGEVVAGKYQLVRLLGWGGVGVVVEARHLQLDCRVAVKFLLAAALEHRNSAERLLQEARTVASMRSEHVARIIDMGTLDSGYPYVVMEYLSGTDLDRVIGQRGRLPRAEAVGYVIEACEAVAEAHARGVIHRDLKPANIFITKHVDGSPLVKVLDFGLAKRRTVVDGWRMTTQRTVIGSPPYMSPELVTNSPDVDSATDVWAMGVILYELLSGKRPFEGDSPFGLFAQILEAQPPPMRDQGVEVPVELEQLVHRCLELDPARRPSMAELARGLLPFAAASARPLVERITLVSQKGVVAYSGNTMVGLPVGTAAFTGAEAAGSGSGDVASFSDDLSSDSEEVTAKRPWSSQQAPGAPGARSSGANPAGECSVVAKLLAAGSGPPGQILGRVEFAPSDMFAAPPESSTGGSAPATVHRPSQRRRGVIVAIVLLAVGAACGLLVARLNSASAPDPAPDAQVAGHSPRDANAALAPVDGAETVDHPTSAAPTPAASAPAGADAAPKAKLLKQQPAPVAGKHKRWPRQRGPKAVVPRAVRAKQLTKQPVPVTGPGARAAPR
jgi:serine/threonine-protein kinase